MNQAFGALGVPGLRQQVVSCPHCRWSAIRVAAPGSAEPDWRSRELASHLRARHPAGGEPGSGHP